jgi:CRP/FNR family cyclic AMP-dependent transcriptional regulator
MISKEVFKDCEVFAALSNDELEKLVSSASEKQYEAGEYIFREGESADELFVLKEGRVVLQMALPNSQGKIRRRVSFDVVSANDVFGWPAIIEPYSHTLASMCLVNAKVLSINGNNLRLFLQDNPSVAYEVLNGIIKVVASRLDNTSRLLISERLSP